MPPTTPIAPERLSHLKVSGFRSIRGLDLDLGDLTVLVGANGSGKSNFVGFFNLLRSLLTADLQIYVQRKGQASSILHYGPRVTPELNAELTFAGANSTSRYRFSLGFAAPDRLFFRDEHVWFHRTGEPVPFDRPLGAGHSETQLAELAAQETNPTLRTVAQVFFKRLMALCVYHFHDTSETAPIRLTQDLARNRALLNAGGNLAAFLYMLQRSYPAHYERIVATVRLAVPYFRDFVLEPDRMNAARIQLRWRDRDPDYEFGAHQLSDGSLRAIALITALMHPHAFPDGEATEAPQQLRRSIGALAPEDIDDGPDTAPSRRLIRAIPAYESVKPLAGPELAARITLPRLRAACPHFDAWIGQLERLARAP